MTGRVVLAVAAGLAGAYVAAVAAAWLLVVACVKALDEDEE